MPGPLRTLRSTIYRSTRFAHVAEFIFRRNDASEDVYPDDPPRGLVDGPDPDRVVFIGEPGEISLGVRSHELSLPAFFARHLATVTSRGVSWSISPLPGSRIAEGPGVVEGLTNDLAKADAVVILAGISDTLRIMAATTWERHLRATLAALRERLPVTAQIVISDIPPLDNAGSMSKAARVAAGHHSRLLNRHTRLVAAEFHGVTVMLFPRELTESVWRPEGVEQRFTFTYRVWGNHLADALPIDASVIAGSGSDPAPSAPRPRTTTAGPRHASTSLAESSNASPSDTSQSRVSQTHVSQSRARARDEGGATASTR
ncbi:hypothetical protein [Marisediminicola sp. LYQ134]|uniref:hypothetical protein n=1 Tax=Marisediminicola sp. LYQ134 TaxID=3391061 RepID=UPI003983AB1B